MIHSAYLVFEKQIFLSEVSKEDLLFHTPISVLAEWICSRHSKETKKILRNRIYINYEASPLCMGVVKVVAKRHTELAVSDFSASLLKLKTSHSIQKISPKDLFLFDESNPGDPKVSAHLQDSNGKELAAGFNQTEKNSIWHAEYACLRSFAQKYKKKIPAESKLIISLRPCALCAGLIHHLSEDLTKTHVYFEKNDPGPKAQNSALKKWSDLWKKAGSPKISVTQL